MILAYKRSGILQAVTIVRDNPKSTTVKLVGEPRRRALLVPKSSPHVRLFTDVNEACEWISDARP